MWCNLIVLVAVPVTFAFPIEPLQGSGNDRWFVQKLDHFDLSNTETWKQRYQVNGTWFKKSKSSPIMLYIEGESSIGPKNVSVFQEGHGYLQKYTEQFGAISFVLEHRYYGESHPTEDLSVENLQFLTIQQALADIAQFIIGMNKLYQFQPTNRWILLGGSYAGSLVAWARLKYPHLVHAAVSSSAPLLAEVGDSKRNQALNQTLASYSKPCAENIHQGALDIISLLEEPNGADVLIKKFNISELIDPKDPIYYRDMILTDILLPILPRVKYYGLVAVRLICDVMVDESNGSLIDRYALVNLLSKPLRTVELGGDPEKESYSDGFVRQWYYQVCTELGFFPISSSEEDLFGPSRNLDLYINSCKRTFGGDFNLTRMEEGVQRTNAEYGGVNISVTRVVFTRGTVDPVRVLGIKNSSNPDMPVINIDGGTHCSDMMDPQVEDSQALKTARSQVMDIVGKWISE